MAKDILSCKTDRISDLPAEVTNTILTFLPLCESVRTSILSTKWRYRWNKLSKLVFDDRNYPFSEDNEPVSRYKLLLTINQILLLHDGPILEFNLSHSLLQSCPEIGYIISFLSKSGVHQFTLKILKGKEHKLHSSFFSCQALTHMNLLRCIFTPPPAFKRFHRLVSLMFVNVVFSTDGFKNFVSSCPQLESLTLINPPKFDCLAVSAPSLKYLYFEGDCEFLSFGEVPILQEASLYIEGLSKSLVDERTCKLVEFFCCLPALKNLVASYRLLQHLAIGGVPKKLPTSISLETLKLSEISFDAQDEVSSILCLISSCPSLQRIEIEINNDDDDIGVDEVLDFLKAQDYATDIILDELREVHLTFVAGIEPELEFIKLLLAKSPSLQTLLIQPMHEDVHVRLCLVTEVTRFKRASSMAEIIFG